MAKFLGISDTMLSNIFIGKRGLTWKRANVWAEKLKTTPTRLLRAEPEELKRIVLTKGKKLVNQSL
jgi:hypothetical protein